MAGAATRRAKAAGPRRRPADRSSTRTYSPRAVSELRNAPMRSVRVRAAGVPARRLSLSPTASGHFEALKPREENRFVLKIDRPVAVAARLLSLVSSLHRPFTPEGYSILYSQPV